KTLSADRRGDYGKWVPSTGRDIGRPVPVRQMGPTSPTPDSGIVQMTATISDPRAWRANTIDRPESWYHPLAEATLAALDRDLRGSKRDSQPVTDLTASDSLRKAGAVDRDRLIT